MEPYNWLKLGFIFFAFFEAFLMGLLPVKVKSCRESLTVLGIANAFSGGVFIAIALMHIMPESTAGYDEYMCDKFKKDNPGTEEECPENFPIPYLLLVIGYGIILVLDKVIFDAHSMLHDEGHGHEHGNVRRSITKATIALRDQMEQIANDPQNEDIRSAVKTSQIKLQNEIQKDLVKNYKVHERQAAAIKRQNSKEQKKVNVRSSLQESQTSDGTAQPAESSLNDIETENHFVDKNQIDHQGLMDKKESLLDNKDHPIDERKPTCTENMTPFVLLIGLGAHSIFEGLAVGMANDMEKVGLFVLAIGMHKGAAGMSLGISFLKAFPDREQLIIGLLICFGLFTPFGIALGWILESDNQLLEIVFSCLAAGTFLYIACSEVIIEEFSMPENKYLKFLFFVIGIAIITSLKFIDPD